MDMEIGTQALVQFQQMKAEWINSLVEARRASDAISATLFPLLTPFLCVSKLLGLLIS